MVCDTSRRIKITGKLHISSHHVAGPESDIAGSIVVK